jgi:TPR repeat protein
MNHVEAARYFKLSADPRYGGDQFSDGICPENGRCRSIDFTAAKRDADLTTDQWHVAAQGHYKCYVAENLRASMNAGQAARYFKSAADHGHAEGESDSEGHNDKNFGMSADFVDAAKCFKEGVDREFQI